MSSAIEGRLRSESMKEEMRKILDIWDEWSVYDSKFLFGLEATLLRLRGFSIEMIQNTAEKLSLLAKERQQRAKANHKKQMEGELEGENENEGELEMEIDLQKEEEKNYGLDLERERESKYIFPKLVQIEKYLRSQYTNNYDSLQRKCRLNGINPDADFQTVITKMLNLEYFALKKEFLNRVF